MINQLMPTRPGQICKIISTVPDKEADEVFIVVEEPSNLLSDDEILVVNLKELQRNIKNPDKAQRITIIKNKLVVVGEDLNSYVQSWNNHK